MTSRVDKRRKKRIREDLFGFFYVLVVSFTVTVAAAFPVKGGPFFYAVLTATIVLPTLLIHIYLEFYLTIFCSERAHYYTFHEALGRWLMGFASYLFSINITVFLTPYSLNTKILHVSIVSVAYWGLFLYFRYVFLPKKFQQRDGFRMGVEEGAIDPEAGTLLLGIEWTNEVVYSKSQRKPTFIFKHPALYAVIIALAALGPTFWEIEKATKEALAAAGLGVFAVGWNALMASLWHDHHLVRKWEKENGRTLKIKV